MIGEVLAKNLDAKCRGTLVQVVCRENRIIAFSVANPAHDFGV